MIATIEPKFQAEKYRWLKAQLVTDLLNIDEEVSRIAVLIGDAGEFAAMANEIFAATTAALEESESRECSSLRDIPFNGKSRSEAQIKTEFVMAPAYKQALNDQSEARLDSNLWRNLVDAFKKKSDSLQNVGYLVHAGYLTHNFIQSKRRSELREGPQSDRVRIQG